MKDSGIPYPAVATGKFKPEFLELAKKLRTLVATKVIGKIKPVHDVFGHHYQFADGRIVDSISTRLILKNSSHGQMAAREAATCAARLVKENPERDVADIVSEAMDAPDVFLEDASSIGTEVHGIIDSYVRYWIVNQKRPMQMHRYIPKGARPEVIAAALSAEKFFIDYGPRIIPIASEITVGSQGVSVAGTLDFLCLLDGDLVIFDWKTAASVDDSYGMQLAAYARAVSSMIGVPVITGYVALFSKKRIQYSVYKMGVPLEELWRNFLFLSTVYDFVKDKRPKMTDIKQHITIQP